MKRFLGKFGNKKSGNGLNHAQSAVSPRQSSSSVSDDDDDHDVADMPDFPANYDMKKSRHSVSAEVYGEFNKREAFIAPYFPKTKEQKDRIEKTIRRCFMFSALEGDDLQKVIEAFEEKQIEKDTTVITQGEDGDRLYLIESGEFVVFKRLKKDEEAQYMTTMLPGDAFGELALLYNCPRAATVISKNEAVVWSLDRRSFIHLVKEAAMRRREMYDSFLKEVELLKDMDPYERSKLSDAFSVEKFAEGATVITQGDKGDTFFIIEKGNAEAVKNGESVMQYSRGDYFGELALIKDQPRAASVIAKGELTLLKLDRHSFKRLLGPVTDILKRNEARYQVVKGRVEGNG